jgi:hypothetical protein
MRGTLELQINYRRRRVGRCYGKHKFHKNMGFSLEVSPPIFPHG